MPPGPAAADAAPADRRSVLFVCTGNTCRSPLAEAMLKARLAERLGVPEADLPARGFVVRSAGVAAFPGDDASPPAADVAAEFGANLGRHRSRPVNPELLADATRVFAMTAGHAAVLDYRFPGVGPAPELLAGAEDLPDPYGSDLGVYRDCARAIDYHLHRLITEWLGT